MHIEFNFFASDEPSLVQALHLGLDYTCKGKDPAHGEGARWMEAADVRTGRNLFAGFEGGELPTRENIREVVAGAKILAVEMREGAPVAKHGNHLEGGGFWVCNVDIEKGIARMILADPGAWAQLMSGDMPRQCGDALWKYILIGRDAAIRIEG